MSARGAMITVLATQLANAVAADEQDLDGHDISAGLFGPSVSAFIRQVVDDFIECSGNKASDGTSEQSRPLDVGPMSRGIMPNSLDVSKPGDFGCRECGEIYMVGHLCSPQQSHQGDGNG